MDLFSPLNPVGFALLYVRGRIDRARTLDRGASTIEWVAISAMLIVIAVAVFGILYKVITDKANTIDINTTPAP